MSATVSSSPPAPATGMIGRPSFSAAAAMIPTDVTSTAEPIAIGSRISLRSRPPTRVDEEHPDDVHNVRSGLELRQDHLAELVAGGMAGGCEDVGDFHAPTLERLAELSPCGLSAVGCGLPFTPRPAARAQTRTRRPLP